MTDITTNNADFQISTMTKREERRQWDDRLREGMKSRELRQRAKILDDQAGELMFRVCRAYLVGRATESSRSRALRLFNSASVYRRNYD